MRMFIVTMDEKTAHGSEYNAGNVAAQILGIDCSTECEGLSFADVTVTEIATVPRDEPVPHAGELQEAQIRRAFRRGYQ